MANPRARAYLWARRHVPLGVRRRLKSVPVLGSLGQRSRPKGNQWLPVELTPSITRQMLLPEDAQSLSFDSHEPAARAWIAANVVAGATCVDAGAHLGVFTLLMAELVGPSGAVHAFEPLPTSMELTRRSLEANSLLPRVSLVQAALGDRDEGSLRLYFGLDSPSEASIHPHEVRGESIEVPRMSLDGYAARVNLQHVDVIKMDIEGAEEMALRGAHGILASPGVKVLVEIHGKRSVPALEYLSSLGYNLETLDGEPVDIPSFPDEGCHVVATRGS